MLVKRQVFSIPTFTTTSGRVLKDVRIGYETYGTLNAARDNAILVCHYFAGTAHAAGKYEESDAAPGWWECAIGPGKAFDTDRYFVICTDTLCCLPVFNGKVVTTGPATIDPDTGKPYSIDFPVIRYTDIVRVQKALMDSLQIERLVAVAGPSAGGYQALEWSVEFPDMVPRAIAVGSPGIGGDAHTNLVGDLWTRPIRNDPAWKEGRYDLSDPPRMGVAEAFRIAAVSAMTSDGVSRQLGGMAPAEAGKDPADSILNDYMSAKLVGMGGAMQAKVCDANHYLYLVRAGQLFNIEDRLAKARAKYLLVAVTSDQIASVSMNEAAVQKLKAQGLRAELKLIDTPGGHIDGLVQVGLIKEDIAQFITSA